MARQGDSYTRYPRPILWLVRGGLHGDRAVEPFYLSKQPVTNLQFEAYDPSFRRPAASDGDDDVATGIPFEAALGYCAWYADVSRKAMRLPTSLEWDYARGPDPTADSYRNPFGLIGMAGGVPEWTASDDGAARLRGGTVEALAGFRLARSLK